MYEYDFAAELGMNYIFILLSRYAISKHVYITYIYITLHHKILFYMW